MIRTLLLYSLILLICGCGRRPAQFSLSKATLELSDAAQEVVREELTTSFGTPESLVAWQALPIDFGAVDAVVQNVSDSSAEVKLLSVSGSDFSSRGLAVTPKLPAEETETQESPVETVNETVITVPVTEASFKQGEQVTLVGEHLRNGRALYHRHCVHCHGVSGDGNGPTAQYLTPRPRDYRKGLFKFTSTSTSVRPSRDDLHRVIKYGIPGTYMPSFMLLPENETRELVEYVRWLAMRGEYETKIVVPMQSDFTGNPENRAAANEAAEALKTFRENDLPGLVESSAQELKDDWSAAEDESNAVTPKAPRTPSSPESIERGRKLFLGEKAKCASCHGELGRGNGPSTEAFNDVPGKPGVKSDVPGLFDIWGNIIKPRNLTQDVFRGGRRPVDVYRRIHSGIKGTPMQAFGGTLTDEEIWDLVNYVYSIPHTR